MVKCRDDTDSPALSSLGDNPNIVPTTGWQFGNRDTQKYEIDPLFECHPLTASPPCKVTVSLSGLAKETEGECQGEYKETGLMSRGKKESNVEYVSLLIELFVGFQAGWTN